MNISDLQNLTKLVRHSILTSTAKAASGHPTSALSAVELMTTLFFGDALHYDLDNPRYVLNDRVIFSKGHASPLLYALYHAAGVISTEELLTLREFASNLEGHPTPRFKYVDVATGSLGQGLSIGLGMAQAIKLMMKQNDIKIEREPKVWVLLGDSEVAEGQVWEALSLATHNNVNNLIGILDVNRLGQRGETLLGWDIQTYEKRISSFGWNTIVLEDGHDLNTVADAFQIIAENKQENPQRPTMIIAKTIKGKGFPLWENLNGWHSKPYPKDKIDAALKELDADLTIHGKVIKPIPLEIKTVANTQPAPPPPVYKKDELIATKEAFGDALAYLGHKDKQLLVLDGEVSNSTHTDKFKAVFPDRFYETFIAEQNLISTAVGFSKMNYNVFASTFAAFLTRAFDQIRMAQYSNAHLRIACSYAGASAGKDGPSGMGLEDIAMMRSILESIVLYPADATATGKLTEAMWSHTGISYLRLAREKTPLIYSPEEQFVIGGSKVLHESDTDKAVVIAAGITLHEALKAYDILAKEQTAIAVVDAYSAKPIDKETILRLAQKTKKVVVVEDHYPYGGLGEAVKDALAGHEVVITHLAVTKIPRSGTPQELLRYEEIDAEAICNAVKG